MKVLILGGCGFIGRHLVQFLASQEGVTVRVADKKIPVMCHLNEAMQDLYDNEDFCEFLQADLSREADIASAFEGSFDCVVNLTASSAFGSEAEVYKQHITKVAELAGAEAARTGVNRFIHVSTAQVYKANKASVSEASPLEPWTTLAKAHLEAETALQAVAGLELAILRPAVVYGAGDINGLMPRIVCGRVYQHLQEKMKLLGTADLAISTVHVEDVVKAIWLAKDMAPGSVYNVADSAHFTVGDMNDLLAEVFGIKTGFVSGIMNGLARKAFGMAVNQVNNKHMKPWHEICQKAGIFDTCLSPFLSAELLDFDHHMNIDGTAIAMEYSHPKPTPDAIRAEIEYWIAEQQYPTK